MAVTYVEIPEETKPEKKLSLRIEPSKT